MIIKYKKYIGELIYANKLKNSVIDSEYEFVIVDSEGISINFVTKIEDIRIVNCLGNTKILSEIQN